jgi:hypothetical protein
MSKAKWPAEAALVKDVAYMPEVFEIIDIDGDIVHLRHISGCKRCDEGDYGWSKPHGLCPLTPTAAELLAIAKESKC